ncbi:MULTISPECIES: GNAT family N-acetyltransferase [Paenibacillus]|uniref:GNAT family N-acetyltransferase n=1 Tax=Paenibacillus cucumis (ex Kampfer et al. 2016) TaxID=1776858 RepID=A0ABS7KEQ7_9BACL|nr:GNAT family N-acetyltransferase [Paenibacillus cucumis (ex Kampfer et al. 2016)]MBY0202422.1 GNAT family N-acetyltransferase [Paenibacillus cucumis (ex Kampfer et al. 2016)]MDP9701560.1 GNAT superfamily N-acetyltransferase [Paenibacillus intestini]
MDVVIREIRETDYSDVVMLWNNDLGSPTVTSDNISARIERLNSDENYKIIVAVSDNKVVGCISMVQIMALEYEIGYLQINGLVVQKNAQQKGIGTKLIDHAEDFASKNGLSYMILNCGFQRTKAHEFYESKGFDRLSYCFTKAVR